MASIRKKRLPNLSPVRRKAFQGINKSKPIQYLKALFNILLKIQPFFSIIVAILVTVPLAYVFTSAVDKVTASDQDLVYSEGVIGEFTHIDPLPLSPLDKPFSQLDRDITRLLFDPLFTTNTSGNVVGILADTFEVKDNGAKYIIKLRDRKWSDGSNVTAFDVQDTFNMIKNIGSAGLYFAAIDGVEAKALDPKTIEFTLGLPNGAFLDTLYWPVLPQSQLVLKYDDLINGDFGRNPISTTGWNIKSISENDVILKNNQTNKSIRFAFYSDMAQLDKALNAGFIDGYYSTNLIPERNYTNISTYPLFRQLYSLYFNMSDTAGDIIKDPNVRKAISYGLDRKEISQDLGLPRQSIINETSWAFNPGVNTFAYDQAKAIEILETAGYKMDGEYRKANGKDIQFNLSIPDVSVRVKQAQKIEAQMKKIGIKVNIKAIKDNQFINNELKENLFYKSVILTRNFDAIIYSVDSSMDPDKFSQWHSTKIPNYEKQILGLNFTGYNDFRVDAYLRQGRNQFDTNARRTPYFQFQKVFYDDAPVATLYNPYLFYATSKKVKNVDFEGAVRVEDRFVNFDKWTF